MSLYCTLADARAELKAATTVADASLFDGIRRASRRLDRYFAVIGQPQRDFFVPTIESREWLVEPFRVNSFENTFSFDSPPLLALTGVTRGVTALVVGTNVQAWPSLHPPYRKLRLTDWSLRWYPYYWPSGNMDPPMVTITGTWGFHRDYTNAFLSVDTLNGTLNASATSFVVADVDGSDAYGHTPRISAGNLVQIDSEWLDVTATNTTTDTVTVRRGVNGSTAAAHNSGAVVSVWQTEEPVNRAIYRQVALMYARRGAFESSVINEAATVIFPADLLTEVRDIMQGYAYE